MGRGMLASMRGERGTERPLLRVEISHYASKHINVHHPSPLMVDGQDVGVAGGNERDA